MRPPHLETRVSLRKEVDAAVGKATSCWYCNREFSQSAPSVPKVFNTSIKRHLCIKCSDTARNKGRFGYLPSQCEDHVFKCENPRCRTNTANDWIFHEDRFRCASCAKHFRKFGNERVPILKVAKRGSPYVLHKKRINLTWPLVHSYMVRQGLGLELRIAELSDLLSNNLSLTSSDIPRFDRQGNLIPAEQSTASTVVDNSQEPVVQSTAMAAVDNHQGKRKRSQPQTKGGKRTKRS
jgi:hypothetical protein